MDYTKRFKQLRDVFKSHLSFDILDKFIKYLQAYQNESDETKKTEMKKPAHKTRQEKIKWELKQ